MFSRGKTIIWWWRWKSNWLRPCVVSRRPFIHWTTERSSSAHSQVVDRDQLVFHCWFVWWTIFNFGRPYLICHSDFIKVCLCINRWGNKARRHQMCSEWGHAALQGSVWEGRAFHSFRGKTNRKTFHQCVTTPGFNLSVRFFCCV